MARRSAIPLAQAQKIIQGYLADPGQQVVSLEEAAGRICYDPNYALVPVPSYNQSLYDGYIIAKHPCNADENYFFYRIRGEIAAGDTEHKICRKGDSFRIMTGGMVPSAGWKVIPQEHCRVDGNIIRVEKRWLKEGPEHIRRKGADYRKGARICGAGRILNPYDIGRLADTGHENIGVCQRPVVAHCCTGSELVGRVAEQQSGLKVSSNRYLLRGLVLANGGVAQDNGCVKDDPEDLADHLMRMQRNGADMIISTGGMGPGKYDLVKDIFKSLGGEVVFTGLHLRPGKSVLFGILDKTLYFGLPGPPPAVKALFQVLIRPSLLKLHGLRADCSGKTRTVLKEDLYLRQSRIPRLLEGTMTLDAEGGGAVLSSKSENTNCYILCPSGRRLLRRGSSVAVYRNQPPPWLSWGEVSPESMRRDFPNL